MNLLRIETITFRSYRAVSLLGAAAALLLIPMTFGAFWTSQRLFHSEKPGFVFEVIYVLSMFILAVLNRNAKCPSCNARLSFLSPFMGRCSRCKSLFKTVNV